MVCRAAALSSTRPPISFPRRIAQKELDGLTAREGEVAAQIAQGLSNREIGEVLVVNERTIEKHISNILSKLSFTSRRQIDRKSVV